MQPLKQIILPDWFPFEAIEIVRLLNGEINSKTMFVGGCVRNALLGDQPTDIDCATEFLPDEVMKILSKAGVKVIPTGIDHGTVTAVKNKVAVEITTLRQDIETDGRHAEVVFSNDWRGDAARRDFTINALYMDLDGNIYDPTGQGLSDLEGRQIRFVGDADKRIKEDYLRILRFFRFQAQYGQGDIDEKGILVCRQNAEQIKTLSRERITQEFFKIILSKRAVNILDKMFEAEVLKKLRGHEYNAQHLQNLIEHQSAYEADISEGSISLSRYFILSGGKATFHDDLLIFSKAQANFIIRLEAICHRTFFEDEKMVKRSMVKNGRDLTLQGYLLLSAQEQIDDDKAVLDLIKNWDIPECPITGETLLNEGYATGPELGQELERRKEEWLEQILLHTVSRL